MKHLHSLFLGICILALFVAIPSYAFASGNNSKNNTATDSITVYVFLSETCPICQTLTLELKRLYDIYDDQGIKFVGLFPNNKSSNEGTVKKYSRKYSIPFDLKMDDAHEYVKRFAATTTPQVFVVRNADNSVLYKGKADNHFEAIGKRRDVTTEHYLESALENIVHNKPINPAETVSVGCFIAP